MTEKITLTVSKLTEDALEGYDFNEQLTIQLGNIALNFFDGEPEDNNTGRNFNDVWGIEQMIIEAYNAGKNGVELDVKHVEVDDR